LRLRNKYYANRTFVPNVDVLDSSFALGTFPVSSEFCCDPVIGITVEVGGVGKFRPGIPLIDTMSCVSETTISSDARAMMTNKTDEIKLGKYLSPNDS